MAIIINVEKEDLEKLEFTYTVSENVKWYFCKNSLSISSKHKHKITTIYSNFCPMDLKEMETYVHTNLYPNVHSIIICNTPKLETIQISTDW